MPETITSPQNPKIKDLLVLETQSRERKARGLFVVEGRREFERACAAGFEPVTVFVREGEAEALTAKAHFLVSHRVYEKIAWREGTEGIVAVMRVRETNLESLQLSASPLVLVLERVEKPGNLGAVLRSADAAGVDAVLVCDSLTDLYNPNLIRASLGAVFSVPVVACHSDEAAARLKRQGIAILTAQLQDSELYYETDMVRPTALVFGAEDTGLSPFWRERADAHIRIPMAGMMDSLNVSVSAAILAFEAVRQRNQQKRQ
ncbi:MAG: RNA methyltransferase [Bacteroidales bacterium]|nr:RNA methyltransferase [Bacteroidales bacterium]